MASDDYSTHVVQEDYIKTTGAWATRSVSRRHQDVDEGWVPMEVPFPTEVSKLKARKMAENGGFLTQQEVSFILTKDPMCKVLVKHGMGRLICSVQDLKFIIQCIERYPEGYIRSVEFYSPNHKEQ